MKRARRRALAEAALVGVLVGVACNEERVVDPLDALLAEPNVFSAAALDGEWDVAVTVEGEQVARWIGSATRASACEWSVVGPRGALVLSANYLEEGVPCADACAAAAGGPCGPFDQRPLVRLGSVVHSSDTADECGLVFDEATACGHPPLAVEGDGAGPSTVEVHAMLVCPDGESTRRGCFGATLTRRD